MISFDLYLVFGIIIAGFSVPSIIGAFADRRAPRVAAITVLIGGGMILYALTQRPVDYTWQEIPEAFIRVVAYFFR